jgi:tRNA A37 threonylcarbamoyladenosine biosynthesis protein TsaE
MQIQLNTLAETQAFAAQLAGYVQLGDVITLKGTLGAGKSEFARAFIKTLAGQNTVVPSPTFTIFIGLKARKSWRSWDLTKQSPVVSPSSSGLNVWEIML